MAIFNSYVELPYCPSLLKLWYYLQIISFAVQMIYLKSIPSEKCACFSLQDQKSCWFLDILGPKLHNLDGHGPWAMNRYLQDSFIQAGEAEGTQPLTWWMISEWVEISFYDILLGSCCSIYPLVIKHGNRKSPVNAGFDRTITDEWSIFHCHVWLGDGISR